MTKFNINLGRRFVFSSKARYTLSLAFLLYLLVCGVLIVFICNRASANFAAAETLKSRIEELGVRFAMTHPDGVTINDYHDQILKKLESFERELNLLEEHTPQHLPVVQVLVELVEPLPNGVRLLDCKYDHETRLLQFSVVIPRDANLSTITSDKLISNWRKQPLIRTDVELITAIYNGRTTFNNRDVSVVRFRCILKRKV
jgi:hypothetical protein